MRADLVVVDAAAGLGDDAAGEAVRLVDTRLNGLALLVGRDEPHAPTVITATSATASPTTRLRSGGDGQREVRVTRPR